jgi:hypothetical protein
MIGVPRGLPGMPGPRYYCPVCEMEIEHEPGCPYEGLSMKDAWNQFRLDQVKARSADQVADPGDSGRPRPFSADSGNTSADRTDQVDP